MFSLSNFIDSTDSIDSIGSIDAIDAGSSIVSMLWKLFEKRSDPELYYSLL